MIAFLVMGKKAIVNMQLVFVYTKGLLSEAYPQIKVKLFMHRGPRWL